MSVGSGHAIFFGDTIPLLALIKLVLLAFRYSTIFKTHYLLVLMLRT